MEKFDIQQIRQRVEMATSGPWEAVIFSDKNPNDEDFIRVGGLDDSKPDMYVKCWLGGDQTSVPLHDLEFIAHAREDIPALLEEIDRLRTERKVDEN